MEEEEEEEEEEKQQKTDFVARRDAVCCEVQFLQEMIGNVHVGNAFLGNARQLGGAGARQLAQLGQHQRRLLQQRQRRQLVLLLGQGIAPHSALYQTGTISFYYTFPSSLLI